MAQGRIATVDLRKVFDKYWKTQQADAAFKTNFASAEKDHNDLVSDLKKAKEEYQTLLVDASNPAVSAEERDKRKKAAEAKLKQVREQEESITNFDRTAGARLEEQKRRMRENLVEEIRTVLNARAKSAGYSLVLDTSATSLNSTPIVLFSNSENDLTDSVITQLNANAPLPETTQSDAKPADKKDDKKDDKKKK